MSLVKKNVMICMYCGELLKFLDDKGWVHQNGSIYIMECKDCGYVGETSIRCPKCQSINYVDHHCALPIRS